MYILNAYYTPQGATMQEYVPNLYVNYDYASIVSLVSHLCARDVVCPFSKIHYLAGGEGGNPLKTILNSKF